MIPRSRVHAALAATTARHIRIIAAAFLVCILWMVAASSGAGATDAPPVGTDAGPVVGAVTGDVVSYKGLPYAAPPVGALRWRPPQPVQSWAAPFTASSFGKICPQNASPGLPPPPPEAMSEDCLTLNIWAPRDREAGPYPVMVWIHGGGYVTGAGSLPIYDGSELARQGVVVVTLNYRLNVFGFFAHPELRKQQSSEPLGNYGLMDQIAALQWIARNIAVFGGDPGNVTIFGESAGGGSVNYLMASPATAGLFHKAIAQSAAAGLTPEPMLTERSGFRLAVERQGELLATALKIDPDTDVVAELRGRSFAALLAAADPRLQQAPMVDGQIVPDHLVNIFAAGRQHAVPYMTGSNSWEASLGHAIGGGFSPEFRARSMTEDLRAQFYPGLTETEAVDQWFGDSVILAPARFVALQMAQVDAPAYVYHLAYVAQSLRDAQPGAAHGDDIPFIFKTLDAAFATVAARDREVSDAMSALWVAFAKTGTPDVPDLPAWPPFDATEERVLVIGDTLTVEDGFLKDRLTHHQRKALEGGSP